MQFEWEDTRRIVLAILIIIVGYFILNELYWSPEALMHDKTAGNSRLFYFVRFVAIFTFLYCLIRLFVKSKQ